MTNNRISPQFTPDCTKGEQIFGWFWLLMHMLVLPVLIPTVLVKAAPDATDITVNILYYGITTAVVMIFFLKLLRREFDHLMDRFFLCVKAFFAGYLVWYALSLVMAAIMTAFSIEAVPPNDQAVDLLARESFNITMVISVISAPIAEEVLFRGVLFQSIRKRSRLWAYVASLLIFGVYHTWQFAVFYQDPIYLLYSLQYIPITFAITWSYECSGSLWTAVFFHASNNYLAMTMLQAM